MHYQPLLNEVSYCVPNQLLLPDNYYPIPILPCSYNCNLIPNDLTTSYLTPLLLTTHYPVSVLIPIIP
jgi:hypothetical protein